MKTELDANFELKDDPEFTRFVIENLSSLLILAYFIMAMAGCGIVIFANWLIKNYG